MDTSKEKEIQKLLNSDLTQHYLINYFLDANQYDGRSLRILNYFYLNNEPLFYLAFSYCSKLLYRIILYYLAIISFVMYSLLRRKIVKTMFSKFTNRRNKQLFIKNSLKIR